MRHESISESLGVIIADDWKEEVSDFVATLATRCFCEWHQRVVGSEFFSTPARCIWPK
jgi:hypothetical protein